MSKQTEALKLALDALEYINSHYMSLPKIGCMALAAVEEALSAQKTCLVANEPCKHGSWCSEVYCQEHCKFIEQPAQQQEPSEYVQKVIDALYENSDPVSVEAAELLERMEQPEQEPAAWVETREDGSIYWGCETDTVISDDPSWLERPVPVYFAPPPRKPLTDEQIEDLYFDKFSMSELKAFARAIEAAHGIKEKNNG